MARTGVPTVRLRAFPVVLTVLTIVLMIGTGTYIINRFRTTFQQSNAAVAKVYVSQYLQPYALAYVASGAVKTPEIMAIEASLSRHLALRPDIVVRIWLLDGRLAYSNTSPPSIATHDTEHLNLAISGTSVSHLETDENGETGGPIALPYLEIYLPILDPATGKPIAVGELYVDARALLDDASQFERTVWLVIGAAMLGVIGMLVLSTRQSEDLRRRLDAERGLVASNQALRNESEQARLDAAQANEDILNFVGAEIHDGPVQLLGLASLMAADMPVSGSQDKTSPVALVRQAMDELRRISAGLILPELEALDLRRTIELAVQRHRALTDATVDLAYDADTSAPGLDLPRRICLYRVTQEGLTNATRHGDDGPVSVSLASDQRTLVLTIESPQAGPVGSSTADIGPRLGLQGMRRRLASYNGTATLDPRGDRAALVVTLPLPTANSDSSGRPP
ncbi:MAG: sensor histidine kinase [Paracoccaceae bacterium]